jgi:tRNA(Ile)-lysidine synthase TilS/MesJ
MCRECSLRNVEYKCRVNLQNKIKINQSDKLLVGLSGGINSTCLVNVLRELQIRFQKHMLFDTMEVIHVDLSILTPNHNYKEDVARLIKFS